ncbi:MAG TPA: DUF2442 domain-containing protein [Candidatus Acidoferrum sp.]|nr:DUF2442 domain-containing protein [Candidatus Acidoferrum sp.]
MNSSLPGKNTSSVEVTNISPHGIWLLCRDEELFLSYDDFPWFKGKPKQKVRNVQEVSPEHLFWPDMDVDLELDAIRHPEKFPLIAK